MNRASALLVLFFFLFLQFVVGVSSSWAQDVEAGGGPVLLGKIWAGPYALVILAVVLGMAAVCIPGRRRGKKF